MANRHSTCVSNKSSNLNARRTEQRRKITTVPEMSPEARRAILLAREDSKVNNKNNSRKRTDGSSHTRGFQNDTDDSSDILDPNNNSTNIVRQKDHKDTTKSSSNLNVKTPQPATRSVALKNPKISSSSSTSRPPRAPKVGTARSRSTLSQNEPPFSMSDNNEISSHLGTNTASNASVYTSNMSSGNNNNSNSHSGNVTNRLPNTNLTDVNAGDDDDNDSALPNDESFEDEEEDTAFNKNSFVLALDKALEKSYVSRLKGDITDTARDLKPGTVRALNGGRLTNAQEVVVNVCHNDDTELVFHDDDEESIDTAKAISEIRVNIWMEYNSRFPQDNSLNDFDPNDSSPDDAVDNENKKKRQSSSETTSKYTRQPSASVVNKSREKSAVLNERSVRKLNAGGGSVKGGANSSSASGGPVHLEKPKSSNNNLRLKSIPPSPTTSRRSSATSSRGKVNSVNSSTTKPTAPLRTKR